MLKLLLLARWRHYVNFVRHHFDRRTLLTLAAIGLLMTYQVLRLPSDIGISMRAVSNPGFGEQWVRRLILWLPAVYVILFLTARISLRRTPEFDLARCLPVPVSDLRAWQFVRHLSKTGPFLLAMALPALGDSRLTAGGVLRAGEVLLASLGLDYLALRSAERLARRSTGRMRFNRIRLPNPRGVVSALMIRDALYLLRSHLRVLFLAAIAIAIEATIVVTIGNPTEALVVAAVVHLIHASLQIGAIDVLFKRDALIPGLLKSLPIGGARLWRARALLAAILMALPGIIPLVVGISRGATPATWGVFFLGALVLMPVCWGFLYADVHVALFPRTRVATFLLSMALTAMVLFWFFVPVATPLLAIALLIHWGLRAAGAFDRLELE